ncbi:MAG: dihydrolipoyllysine-residue acetyltransferase [Arenicellales bacterium]
MATREIQVPDIGDFEDVPVIEILVKEGDSIEAETPLVTLESDKASMDVPSPAAGTVRRIMVGIDDKVSKGTPILLLDVDDAGAGGGDTAPQAQQGGDSQRGGADEPSAAAAGPDAAQAETPPAGSVEVTVPDIGDFTGVEVIEVHVNAGDELEAEDPMITLESDKATMDVPSPMSGTVTEVVVKAGDKVSQGDPILTLAARDRQPDAPAAKEHEPSRSGQPPGSAPAPDEAPTAKVPERSAPPPTLPRGAEAEVGPIPHASPSVRRFARELGVDVGQVQGSGRKGRILKEDVQGWVKNRIQQTIPQPAAAAAGPAGPAAGGGGTAVLPEMPDIDFSQFGEVEVVPLNRIKKLTAANLHRAWLHVPHVTQHDEADITELEEFRQELKREAADRGVRVTMLAFLMKACVAALREYPRFNASLEKGGANLILKKYYNIGIAVDTPDGLVVPAIRNVDRKGIYDLAKELGEVSQRARDRKLSPTDLQGACFTISSLGGIGGTAFTPIVNAPEVAILGVSKAQMKPVYQDGEFVARLMLPLALSYDHRVVDGAEGARFVVFLAKVLEDARRLLL